MDISLIIIICLVVLAFLLAFLLTVANHSYERFMEKYAEIDKIPANCDLSLREYFDFLNEKYFDNKISVIQIPDLGGDAYGKGKLFLSSSTMTKSSLAAYTIISHELGHALQDKEGNKLKMLHRLKKTVKFLGFLFAPSIIAGGVLALIGDKLFIPGLALLAFAVILFFSSLFIKYTTIKIEADASQKGMRFLREVFSDEKQLKKCRKFLNDAKLTYWGDFLRVILGWTGLSRKTSLFN